MTPVFHIDLTLKQLILASDAAFFVFGWGLREFLCWYEHRR